MPRLSLCLVAILFCHPGEVCGQSTGESGDPPTRWNEYRGARFDLLFGAGALLDLGAYTQDAGSRSLVGDHEDLERGEIRAVRAFVAGEIRIPHPVGYMIGGAYRAFDQGFDTDTDEVFTWFDVQVFTPIPRVGVLTVGKMKEPISLAREMSLAWEELLERPMHLDAFLPSRNIGVRLANTHGDGRLRWAVGAYNAWLEQEGVGFSEMSRQGILRASGLPVSRPDHREWLHLGLGFRYSDARLGYVQFGTSPEAFPLPRYVDTERVSADHAATWNFEAAWSRGPWWLSGEFTQVGVAAVDGVDPTFRGGHLSAVWAVTGEHRRYRPDAGVVDRAEPRASVHEGGWGLLELAVRASWVDMTDGTIDGGEALRWSVGANWYPTADTRVSATWGLVDLERAGTTGRTGILQARWMILMGP